MSGPRARLPAQLQRAWRKTYEETGYRDLPWFSPTPYPWVRRAVESGWLRAGARVLDVGCGAGTNALFLARSGFRAFGIDLAPAAIAAAGARAERAGLSVSFRAGDALQTGFPNRFFGGLTDVGCFHTLPKRLRPAYAKELYRILAPSGRYCLAWVAAEYTGRWGPPTRPSVREVTVVFEDRFLFRRVEFLPGGPTSIPAYGALLERRVRPRRK
jgi:SAM-dependent methyltransferase